LGADRTIQVSVSPNTMLDKIIQMPTKPAHDFSGLFFIVWKKNFKRFTTAYPRYNVIGDTYRSAHNIFFEWLALFGIIGFLATN
jgi:hypothetical protein